MRLTNLLILTPEQPMEHPPLILHALAQRQLLTLIDDLLSRDHWDMTIARNSLSSLNRLLKQFLLPTINHLRSHAPLARLLTTKVLPSQDQLHGPALSNCPRETLRSARTGDGAQLDLRLAEGCFRRAVDDIAHQGQLASAAEGVSGYGGNYGLADGGCEVGPRGDEVVRVRGGEGKGCHFFDVGAGC